MKRLVVWKKRLVLFLGLVVVLAIIRVVPVKDLLHEDAGLWRRVRSKSYSMFRVVAADSECGAEMCYETGTKIHVRGRVERVIDSKMSWDEQVTVIVGEFGIKLEKKLAVEVGDELETVSRVKDRVIVGNRTRYILTDHEKLVIWTVRNDKNLVSGMGRWIDQIREVLVKRLEKGLPEPHGSLLVGILLGIKSDMSDKFVDALIRSGTIHVVAASGYNISLVGGVLMTISSRFFSRRVGIVIVFLGIAGYAVLAGGEPAIVRAAIMGMLCYSARFLGKEYWASWSLVVTAVVMIWGDPEIVQEAGFWLSVTATGGILWLLPVIDQFGKTLQKFIRRGEIISDKSSKFKLIVSRMVSGIGLDAGTTLAASLATWPILAWHFDKVYVVSPAVNVLVLGLVPVIMFMGLLVVIVELLIPGISWIVRGIVYLPLDLFIKIVEWWNVLVGGFGEINTATWGNSVKIMVLVTYYSGLALIILASKYRSSERLITKITDFK